MIRKLPTFAGMVFIASLILVLGLVSISSAATLQVDNSGTCDDVTGIPAYCTIQAAIGAAADGDTINVAAGTYAEILTVNRPLSIIGAGSDVVTIDATAATGYHLTVSGIDDVTLQGFTLAGSDTGSYGLKISGVDASTKARNITISDVVVQNTGSTGVDILGMDGVTLTDVTVRDTGGAGIALTDVDNATLTDITTSGNGWLTGLAINTYGRFYPGGSDNVTLAAGSVSLAELVPVKVEFDNFNDPANPYPLTNFDPGDYIYAIHNDVVDPNAIVYMADLTAAVNAASLVSDSYIISETDGSFYVGDGSIGVMSIQVAIDVASAGDTIRVLAGTYPEILIVNKPLSLLGEGSGVVTIDASAATGNHLTVSGIDDVTLQGFTLLGSPSASFGLKISGANASTKAQNFTVSDVVVRDTGVRVWMSTVWMA
jgi:hypothetical protein